MNCTNCGTQNPEGTKFCRTCGAPMTQNAAPAPGYAPNPAYAPQSAAPAKSDVMKLLPAIAAAVALLCVVLPWYTISMFGVSESATVLGTAFDFESWEVGFSAIMLSLLSIGCIVAAGFTVFASVKKLPIAKIVAFAGAVIAFLTMFAWDSCADAIAKGLSEYAKVGFAFYLYIIAMVGAGVVSILNEKK
ncbi:MAG: zinc-ribbon domain-containing protein [Oscillospiraceae bacterium]|nr:zinc-ribbon domain-containing protein [Oscillospiraceae bacterium]